MRDEQILRKIREFDAKLQGLDAKAAISMIDALVLEETSSRVVFEMLVKKAMLLSSQPGMSCEAIRLFEHCASFEDADEGAAYYAAELLVVAHRYREALSFLQKAERQMEARDGENYASCIYLLHAYCAFKLGDLTNARQFLKRSVDLDDELSLFWVKTTPLISSQTVWDLIENSNSNSN